MQTGALVGVATRYIAGRNAVQTVYWRSKDNGTSARMLKVSKTFAYGRLAKSKTPPQETTKTTMY